MRLKPLDFKVLTAFEFVCIGGCVTYLNSGYKNLSQRYRLMRKSLLRFVVVCCLVLFFGNELLAKPVVQLGPRPYFILDKMKPSKLKDKLIKCAQGNKQFHSDERSIGHRGAPLQFPEHTLESYRAAARMGAGKIECDVSFTKDRQLVCRHSQCDLHSSTNILLTDLARKCSQPFIPASPSTKRAASARCCTSDITLKEFKSLCGKMDGFSKEAMTKAEFVNGTAPWRTDLYSHCGTLLSHKESIELFKKLGVGFIPELKEPLVSMPFQGNYSRRQYANQLVNEYKLAGIDPKLVWIQSFHLEDVKYWLSQHPDFASQIVYLDDSGMDQKSMKYLARQGLRMIAPPQWALVSVDRQGKLIPSDYAIFAKNSGLGLITWTLERSGPLENGGGWYYKTFRQAIETDGGVYHLLDLLFNTIEVEGVFSDWPATTTFFLNCMKT